MTAYTAITTNCNPPNIKLTTSSRNTNPERIVQTLGPYDILCGRCKTAFNNIGNRRFRVTISMNLQAYLATATKPQKSILIASISTFLREQVGARFLKPQKGGGYIELDDKEARQKIGHALRDLAVAKQQSTMTELATQQELQRKNKEENTQQKATEDDVAKQQPGISEDDHEQGEATVLQTTPQHHRGATEHQEDKDKREAVKDDEGDNISLASSLKSWLSELPDDNDSDNDEPNPFESISY